MKYTHSNNTPISNWNYYQMLIFAANEILSKYDY